MGEFRTRKGPVVEDNDPSRRTVHDSGLDRQTNGKGQKVR